MQEKLEDLVKDVKNDAAALKYGEITIHCTVKKNEIVFIKKTITETFNCDKKAS